MIVDMVQRWECGRESRRPVGELIRPSEYDVELIADWSIARDFVSAHHYARSASSTSHSFGLYRGGELVGVALFGPPASMAAHQAVFPTLEPAEAVTLGRLVLLDAVPSNAESWFVARCFALLRRRGVAAVESCADPEPRTNIAGESVFRGHLGIVYQALSARYLGRTRPATLRLLPDGTVLSNRACGKLLRGERGAGRVVADLQHWGAAPLEPNEDSRAWLRRWCAQLTRSMRHYGNHRYVWFLNKQRCTELLQYGPLRQYPKIEGDVSRRRAA